jgi:hypothetical protein
VIEEKEAEKEGTETRVPPKPVAIPTVPSDASISTKKDPRTLMPQVVLDFLYLSQMEQGVEISESTSLSKPYRVSPQYKNAVTVNRSSFNIPVTTFYIMVIATCAWVSMSLPIHHQFGLESAHSSRRRLIPDPTPSMIKDRTALMVGNCRMEVMAASLAAFGKGRWIEVIRVK